MRTLLVNDVDIADYGATLLSIDYGYSTVTTYNDWLTNKKSPIYYRQTEEFSTAIIRIAVEAPDIYQLDRNCSNLMALFKRAVVKDTEANMCMDGHFVQADDNRIGPLGREIEIEFEGVKYSPEKTISHVMDLTPWVFEVDGNLETEPIINIYPDMGYTELVLNLNGTSFQINTIPSNSICLTINTQEGVVLLDGRNKIEDYLSWQFPILQPGLNTLIIENRQPQVSITYKGRWM